MEADWEGLGTEPRIPSFASLTLDLVIVVPYLKKKKKKGKLEIISSNPVLSWRKRARPREELTKVTQWSQAPRPGVGESLLLTPGTVKWS